jgi:hypothetical protein
MNAGSLEVGAALSDQWAAVAQSTLVFMMKSSLLAACARSDIVPNAVAASARPKRCIPCALVPIAETITAGHHLAFNVIMAITLERPEEMGKMRCFGGSRADFFRTFL